jgi:hypothetical protein
MRGFSNCLGKTIQQSELHAFSSKSLTETVPTIVPVWAAFFSGLRS